MSFQGPRLNPSPFFLPPSTERPTKKAYARPRLTAHGDLRTLTQSGSGRRTEGRRRERTRKPETMLRKPYTPPRLITLGRVCDLTQGGSRGQKEVFSPNGL